MRGCGLKSCLAVGLTVLGCASPVGMPDGTGKSNCDDPTETVCSPSVLEPFLGSVWQDRDRAQCSLAFAQRVENRELRGIHTCTDDMPYRLRNVTLGESGSASSVNPDSHTTSLVEMVSRWDDRDGVLRLRFSNVTYYSFVRTDGVSTYDPAPVVVDPMPEPPEPQPTPMLNELRSTHWTRSAGVGSSDPRTCTLQFESEVAEERLVGVDTCTYDSDGESAGGPTAYHFFESGGVARHLRPGDPVPSLAGHGPSRWERSGDAMSITGQSTNWSYTKQ